jgi:hypothetical protein
MKTLRFRRARALATVALLALASACGGGSNDVELATPGATSKMHVITCNLGCSGPAEGSKTCATSDVFVNQTLAFEFNKPIDPQSIASGGLRLTNLQSGEAAPGLIEIDPSNPRRLTYRPSITLDDFGQLVPGFVAGEAYRMFVRGSGAGPRIRATDGSPNVTTIDCFVIASKGVLDLEPGAPQATVFIDVYDPLTNEVTSTLLADGQVDVPLTARVRVEFDQIMSASTLIELVGSTSPSVRVRFDEDGDTSTPNDQVPLPGQFAIDFDEKATRTQLVFAPNGPLPSAGTGPLTHRVVVEVGVNAKDIAGTALAAATKAVFTPLAVPIPTETVRETFQSDVPIALRSSSAVAEPLAVLPGGSLRGRVLPGVAGGNGELGDVVVRAGETLVLSTGPDVVTRFGPNFENGAVDAFGAPSIEPEEIVAYQVRAQVLVDAASAPSTAVVEVDDGVFEFASLVVQAGGVLTFEGDLPPRVFVRGELSIAGLVDVSGRSGGDHFSTNGLGGSGGPSRLAGGAGGDGGDRPDQPTGSQMLPTQGPTFRGFDHTAGSVVDPNGAAGVGRGGTGLGGGGGVKWPPTFPGPFVVNLGTLADASYLNILCAAVEVGAPGAGGTFASLGGNPFYSVPAQGFGIPPAPPAALPTSTVVTVDELELDPDRSGALVGGAGGGGGGAGIQGTTTNGIATNNCIPPGQFPIKQITGYLDASGGAGGSGGGALQLQSGRSIVISGLVDASGGNGAGIPFCVPVNDGCWTAPGGGGSGGALLLQTPLLSLFDATVVLDVSGGLGGVNGNTLSRGGSGGAGVVEVQAQPSLTVSSVQPRLAPTLGGAGQPLAMDVLEVEPFAPPTTGPGLLSGFTTCWIVPDAGLFGFSFVDDDTSASDPSQWIYSWNLVLELDTGELVNWRGDSGSITDEFDVDFETLVGRDLGTSPLVVRFQGVRANAAIQNKCTFDALDPIGGAEVDSVTPWLASPGELDTYWPGLVAQELADARRPNAMRMQVVFDPTAPFADRIVSVVEFTFEVQPR